VSNFDHKKTAALSNFDQTAASSPFVDFNDLVESGGVPSPDF